MNASKRSTESIYISSAVNRFPRCAAVSPDYNVVAFGSHKLIAIWNLADPTKASISQAIIAHEAIVTCVHFLNEGVIVSGDESGNLVFTTFGENEWNSQPKQRIHDKAVSFLTSHEGTLVSGGSDGSVGVWRWGTDSYSLSHVETIKFGGKLPLDAAIKSFSSLNLLVLAVATTSDVIRVFVRENGKFISKLSLPGHEDWVRCLAMISHPSKGSDIPERLTLASGSQDGSIRLWSVDQLSGSSPFAVLHSTNATHDQILDSIPNDDTCGNADGSAQITSKQHVCKVSNGAVDSYLSISLDALLVGHEAGITSLSWNTSDPQNDSPSILSTSTDSSLILWATSSLLADDSLWIIQQRFGDLGGQRLGGFVGGFWASGGKAALAYGWNGCWRRWTMEGADSGPQWTERMAITGHQDVVRGLSWSPGGDYLISTGQDQTTRIHAPLSPTTWHEINRPQIHGYDLVDIVHLGDFSFASIADEKVVRVFEASQPFVKVMKQLGAFEGVNEGNRTSSVKLPPLGLSNKAAGGQDMDAANTTAVLLSPELSALESNLSVNTLWPEVEKLFGHGYELNALAASHSGRYVASACRATNAEHAVIRLFDTKTWQPFGSPLAGHTLTITRICWSSDDKFILSVSRDRTWRIHSLLEDSEYVPTCAKKSHARVIWDCAWLPNSHTFVTGARDKAVQVWNLSADGRECQQLCTMSFDLAVTALDSIKVNDEKIALSVGLENGDILIYLAKQSDLGSWTLVEKTTLCAATIERVAWRPVTTHSQPSNTRELAIASEDRSLRIVKVHFY